MSQSVVGEGKACNVQTRNKHKLCGNDVPSCSLQEENEDMQVEGEEVNGDSEEEKKVTNHA